MSRKLLVSLAILLAGAPAAAGQTLLYSLSAGAATPFPRVSRTEIYAVDPRTAEQRIVFSDAGLDWMLLPAYPGGGERQAMVTAAGRVFARGFSRKHYQGGWPTWPAALYELKLDRSNQARKIFDIEGSLEMGSNFRNLFADPAAARVGYMTYENGKPFVILRETGAGALLRRTDLSRTTLDCLVTNIGFTPGGERIFFSLDTGDVDATSRASYGRVGSYTMKTDGSPPVRIEKPANLVAPLPDGRNLYAGRPPSSFLYLTGPGAKARRDYATPAAGVLDFFRLSPDGRLVAYLEEQRNYKPVATIALVIHWIDLESGQDKSLPPVATKPVVLPWVNLIGWLDAR